MNYTFSELSRTLQKKLAQMYPKNIAHHNAVLLLEKLTGKRQEYLIMQHTITLSIQQEELLEQWIDHIINDRMPLQYILGSTEFLGLTIFVKQPILIPRPETEYWVSLLIEQCAQHATEKLTILDLCSGSGCIGLALARSFKNSHVYALDIEPTAVTLGKRNADYNNLSNIEFIESDLFTRIPKDTTFDIIVSNPPYIAHKEWKTLQQEVKDWEDPRALVANDQGYSIIKKIIEQAPQYLHKKHNIGQLWIEIGWQQGPLTQKYFEEAGFHDTTIIKDLAKKDRVVMGHI